MFLLSSFVYFFFVEYEFLGIGLFYVPFMVAIFFYCFAASLWRCAILVIALVFFLCIIFLVLIFVSFAQFGECNRHFSACKLGDTGALESGHGSLVLSSWSKSKDDGFGLLQYSKPYVLFSTTDATLVAIDYSRGNLDDGIVDSPPS